MEWIASKREYSLLNYWLSFDPGFGGDLWSDFEHALGQYNINDMYEYCTRNIAIDYDHMMRSGYGLEDAPGTELPPLINLLHKSLLEWITESYNSGVVHLKKEREFPSEASYLSFNYTPLLENLYNIPQDNILHIHGSLDGFSDLIVGHDNIQEYDEGEHDIIYAENAKHSICGLMNELYKDVDTIIEANREFFIKLHEIDEVVAYGHSYNKIDLPYFRKVAESVSKHCQWGLSFYPKNKEADIAKAESLVENLRVEKNCYRLFPFGE